MLFRTFCSRFPAWWKSSAVDRRAPDRGRADRSRLASRVRLCTSSHNRSQMTTTLSVRLDIQTKKRLEALAKRARRSKSFLAAEAIAAFVDAESWQLDEIQMGLHELDGDVTVDHKQVSTWLRSWGGKRERKA